MFKYCSHSVRILLSNLVVCGVGHVDLAYTILVFALRRAEEGGVLQMHDVDDVNNARNYAL